jgi:hypothetical protein
VIDLVFAGLLAAARAHLDGGPARAEGWASEAVADPVAALNESGCPSGMN